jgi:hypothetical protein
VVAIGGNRSQAQHRSEPQERARPLPSVATTRRSQRMVRRGRRFESVRGLAKAPQIGFWRLCFILHLHYFQRAPGMEPFMELPGPEGAHRSGAACQSRLCGLLSVRDRTVQTELDVVIDERSKREHVVDL